MIFLHKFTQNSFTKSLLVKLGAHVPSREVEYHFSGGKAKDVDKSHRTLH